MRYNHKLTIALFLNCFFVSKALLAGPLFDHVYRNQPAFFTQEQANIKTIDYLNNSIQTHSDAGYLYRISTDLYEHLYPNSSLPFERLETALEDYDTILLNIRDFRAVLLDFDASNNIINYSDIIKIYFDSIIEVTVRNLKNHTMFFLPQGNLDEHLSVKIENARHESTISQKYSPGFQALSFQKKVDEIIIAYVNDLRDSVANVKDLLSLGQKGIKERVLRSKIPFFTRALTRDFPLLSNYEETYADEAEELIFEFAIYNNYLKGISKDEPLGIRANLQRFQELLVQVILDVKDREHHLYDIKFESANSSETTDENNAHILAYRDETGFSIIDDPNADDWDSDDRHE